jgi:bisphosphoglycerate-independent phosphoglycerate mutase (AlkP superfamily)
VISQEDIVAYTAEIRKQVSRELEDASDNEIKSISNGILGNIAPTILELMNLKKPNLMSCESLLK